MANLVKELNSENKKNKFLSALTVFLICLIIATGFGLTLYLLKPSKDGGDEPVIYQISAFNYEIFNDNEVILMGPVQNNIECVYSGIFEIPQTVEIENKSYSVAFIASNAFKNCIMLQSVTIPLWITSIGDNAFQGCTNLTSVFIQQENPAQLTLGGAVFAGTHTSLKIFAPNSTAASSYKEAMVWNFWTDKIKAAAEENTELFTVGELDFVINAEGRAECTGPSSTAADTIETVKIPLSVNINGYVLPVTAVQDGAFADCQLLSEATLPASVTAIGETAFSGCALLSSVTLPASLITISDCAFQGCESLAEIILPESIDTIGAQAFEGCKLLSSVIILHSVPDILEIGWAAFDNCHNDLEVFVPTEAVIAYRNEPCWLSYAEKIVAIVN